MGASCFYVKYHCFGLFNNTNDSDPFARDDNPAVLAAASSERQ
jgi:hypothetical protein